MKTAEFITAAIPDSIRMGTHDDEKLLFSVLVSVLKTYHENASSWDRTIARHIHETLTREYNGIIASHLSQETRDWDAMRAQAAMAPKPHELVAREFDNASDEAAYDAAMERAMALLPSLDAEGRAHINRGIKGYHSRPKPVSIPSVEEQKERLRSGG